MKRHKGIVSSHYKTGKKVHDGISTVDSFHIVLAKRFECDFLATLDKDFNQTTSEIQPLMVN